MVYALLMAVFTTYSMSQSIEKIGDGKILAYIDPWKHKKIFPFLVLARILIIWIILDISKELTRINIYSLI